MALRAALYRGQFGLPTAMASTDTMELGGLSVSGDVAFSNNAKATGLAAANTNGDAISYGQSGAKLDGLDLNGKKISSLATPTEGTDAVNKTYADSLLQGVRYKAAVQVATTGPITLSGEQTIDGAAVVAGDRVLVKDQANAVQNGIYVVAAGAWSRATDMAAASHNGGAYAWVSAGDTNIAKAFYCTTIGTADIVGTDAMNWIEVFAVTPMTLDGVGLYRDGQTLNIGKNAGIAVTAGDIAVDLATTPGLEFDAVGVNGKLQVKVDDGIQVTASGTGVKLDGTTLSKSSSGVKVVGLPSLFEVNGVATQSSVSAANLNTLTNGGDASSLHSHTSNAIPVGAASAAVSKGDPIYFSANDTPTKSEAATAGKGEVVGLAFANAAQGATVNIVQSGVISGCLSGATVNTPYYLGPNGGLVTYAGLNGSGRIWRVGYAKNATDLIVSIADLGSFI